MTRHSAKARTVFSNAAMCYACLVNAKATLTATAAHADPDLDFDRFLLENHDDVAAKLAAGREQVARGEATPLEPLETLLRDARAQL